MRGPYRSGVAANSPIPASVKPAGERKAPNSRAAWIAVLVWCGVAAWFGFVQTERVPLLGYVDLGFHELGHLIMYILPINQVLTAAMGSIMQCAVPLGLAVYFSVWRKDRVASCACAAWA